IVAFALALEQLLEALHQLLAMGPSRLESLQLGDRGWVIATSDGAAYEQFRIWVELTNALEQLIGLTVIARRLVCLGCREQPVHVVRETLCAQHYGLTVFTPPAQFTVNL